jgi:hypothetical protein
MERFLFRLIAGSSFLLGLAAQQEGKIEFRRAVPEPGSVLESRDALRELRGGRALRDCSPCLKLDYTTWDGIATKLYTAPEPDIELDSRDVECAVVREFPVWGDWTRRFYTLELEVSAAARPRLRIFNQLGGASVAALINGQLAGFEEPNSSWVERPRVGTFRSREAAEGAAARISAKTRFEPLTQEALKLERAKFVEFAQGLFWESKCEPESDRARELQDEWASLQRTDPEIVDQIDCSGRPSSD